MYRLALIAVCLGLAGCGARNWGAYRMNRERSADQRWPSPLSDPARVPTLAVRWQWVVPVNPQGFKSSVVVHEGRVFIGNGNGYFYALDAATGNLLWQFPAAADQALTSSFTCNPSSIGIASSAVVARTKKKFLGLFGKEKWVVIFGAPDKSLAPGLGSGRLFALDVKTGAVVWRSPALAEVTGTTARATGEKHEQLGYSSPIVSGNKVFIGIANHCDNPIQNGKVVAVDLKTGSIVSSFSFVATSTRGGGVWSPVASDGAGVYVTTGNTRCWGGGCQTEPAPNHGLSLLRLDQTSGAVTWKLQPVPFALDDDPDWSAGPTLMETSCGKLVASVMKDGWSYAVERAPGSGGSATVRWQFPGGGIPFPYIPGMQHGDTHYKKSGVAWGDVFVVETGGYARFGSSAATGYGKLHALNVCAPEAERVRWILDVPSASTGGYGLGAPVVTGGIFYVGTNNGHIVAIADPSIVPATTNRCANTNYTTTNCVAAGYAIVPIPKVLADVTITGGMWNELALDHGRVFAATNSGRVYMLSP